MRRKAYKDQLLTAGFGKRLFAYLIDWILIYFFSKFVIRLFGLILPETFYYREMIFNLIRSVIYFGYFVLMTKMTDGYTVGKILLKIRVVSQVEEELSWMTVLVRELCGKFVLRKWKIFYLTIFFSNKRQHPFDMLAETVVLDELQELNFEKYEELTGRESLREEMTLEY